MRYLLLGDSYQRLFVETNDGFNSLRYDENEKKWVYGGSTLSDARIGYDPFEPEGSPYRYGSSSSMPEITRISKKEAEKFISQKIDEDELITIFKKYTKDPK